MRLFVQPQWYTSIWECVDYPAAASREKKIQLKKSVGNIFASATLVKRLARNVNTFYCSNRAEPGAFIFKLISETCWNSVSPAPSFVSLLRMLVHIKYK